MAKHALNAPVFKGYQAVQVKAPMDGIISLLVSACESGGSTDYWCEWLGVEWNDGTEPSKDRLLQFCKDHGLDAMYAESPIYLAPFGFGAIKIREFEHDSVGTQVGGKGKVHLLGHQQLNAGLHIMANGGPEKPEERWDCGPQHFCDLMSGNADMTTADVFVQCCILGDIVYS